MLVSLLKGKMFLVMVMVEIQDEAAPSGAKNTKFPLKIFSVVYPWEGEPGGLPVTDGVITYNPYK